MRATLLVVGVLVLLGIAGFFSIGKFKQKIDSALSSQPVITESPPSPTPTDTATQTSSPYLFVPYWAITGDDDFSGYDRLVYFGVPVNEKGIEKTDQGYTSVSTFVQEAGNKEKYLTIRMIDSQTNFAILKNKQAQATIIAQSITLAQKDGFQGIVLNIEVSALPFDSLVGQISNFNRAFYTAAKDAHLSYGVTAYGDSFYRVRPFDIAALGKNADRIFIMAYDFHKAKGNPGPNFPLGGSDTYGYDFEEMVSNFSDAAPSQKLTVVFGLYGYDWKVDDKDVAQDVASPLSLKQIQNQFLETCKAVTCSWKRDAQSAETELRYTDDNQQKHIVWFEDQESVKRKQDFLKRRGIGSSAYWAYSYF